MARRLDAKLFKLFSLRSQDVVMRGTVKWVLAILLLGLVLAMTRFAQSAEGTNVWPNLVKQAEGLGLPTQFLNEIDSDFVTVAFEDLRTYAAEYHPEDHRMIVNMRLSFNSAGGVLKSLDRYDPSRCQLAVS